MTEFGSRIAFIGGGLAAHDLHLPALANLGRAEEVLAVATSTFETATLAARSLADKGATRIRPSTIDEVIDGEYDVVLVAVPIHQTAFIVERLIDAGKAVLAEKPIAETVVDAKRLLARAESRQVTLLAGENFRLQKDFRLVSEYVDAGSVGTPYVYFLNDLHFTSPTSKYAATAWRQRGEHSGGYLVDGGTHIVAGMREMVGRRVESIHALSTATQPYLSNQPDTLLINLKFEGGVIGHLALGYGVYDPEARHPKVYGSDATIALMPSGIMRIDASGEQMLSARSSDTGFEAEWQVLLGSITDPAQRNRCYELTSQSILDLTIIEAAIASAKTGAAITLEL